MNIIFLSGNSKSNQEWIERVKDRFTDMFEKSYVQQYKHWETGEELINLDHELKVVEEKAKEIEPYVIFAKSMGTILTVRGVAEGRLDPKACIFCGVPLGFARNNGYPIDQWCGKYVTPTLFIQNSQDPAASFKEISEYLEDKKIGEKKLIELPGDTHSYEDLEELRKLAEEFLSHR